MGGIMGISSLSPVINIDEEKCINCYACIAACPVKYCMDNSGKKLTINPNLCIGCGHCLTACTHDARRPMDDSKRFFEDLDKHEKIVAIAAPAVASVFKDTYLYLNGYLKSLGVEAVFDVSFGAELTVLSYVDHIKKKNPRMVIAQPCPAIVTFIEVYHPELLPYLAPADSPMLHTLKMIREYYPQYKNHKFAIISPCIGKKREFEETGNGDYNVTMLALKEHLINQKIALKSFPRLEYQGALAERAVTFSSPGGLLDTAERAVPGIRRSTRKIEGIHAIYPYLEEMSELISRKDIILPLLVDCLNCEKGCNGGSGTGNYKRPVDEIEDPIRKRSMELEAHYDPKQRDKMHKKLNKVIREFWKPGLYNREYRNLSGNNSIKEPSNEDLDRIFRSMRKFNPEDLFDCTSCGYGGCKAMAKAIFNGLNKPENCAHFTLTLLSEEKNFIAGVNQKLKEHIDSALCLIDGINNVMNELYKKVGSQANVVNESSAVTGKMIGSLKSTSELSREEQKNITGLMNNAAKGQASMLETIQSVQNISQSVDGIVSAIKIISGIAANTNLLAMNAAIEAAHAGEAGRGFAVVADEIRRLSETTRQNSSNISGTLSNIISGINFTAKCSGDTGKLISGMSVEIDGFANTMTKLINTFGELSSDSSEITDTLSTLRDLTVAIKTSYGEVLSMADKLKGAMVDLALVSNGTTTREEKPAAPP